MGTLVAIEADHPSPDAAESAVNAAFDAVTAVARRMHPHTRTSDLARINSGSLGQPVAIDVSTFELLKLAKRLNELTDGIFDPCLPRQPGRLGDIDISTTATGLDCYAVTRKGVALDFGGFAKGYAVDQGIQVLIARGCNTGLVNAGGDLRAFGPRTEQILLRTPDGGLTEIELTDGALAVSNTGAGDSPPEHQGYYIRRELAKAPGRPYAAVTAREAVIADALAKCVLLCSEDVAARALRTFGATTVGIDPTLLDNPRAGRTVVSDEPFGSLRGVR